MYLVQGEAGSARLGPADRVPIYAVNYYDPGRRWGAPTPTLSQNAAAGHREDSVKTVTRVARGELPPHTHVQSCFKPCVRASCVCTSDLNAIGAAAHGER